MGVYGKTLEGLTLFGPVAHLVEHCIRIAGVGSSNLLRSTI